MSEFVLCGVVMLCHVSCVSGVVIFALGYVFGFLFWVTGRTGEANRGMKEK